jgi:hypothetical protein
MAGLRLDLVACTPGVERLVATAMLTTTSGARPSALFRGLADRPERVAEVVGGLEAQHGSVLEHNRLTWLLEASGEEVLELLLGSRYLQVSRLGGGRWLLSGNLRSVLELAERGGGELTDALVRSIGDVAPTLYVCLAGGRV